jgi:hypothetical protein
MLYLSMSDASCFSLMKGKTQELELDEGNKMGIKQKNNE